MRDKNRLLTVDGEVELYRSLEAREVAISDFEVVEAMRRAG
jgi:hypothetical protein